jgi:hypothetical protein
MCSRNTPQPLTTPQVPPHDVDSWCCFDFRAFVLDVDSSLFTPDDDEARPLDRAERIPRPPWR